MIQESIPELFYNRTKISCEAMADDPEYAKCKDKFYDLLNEIYKLGGPAVEITRKLETLVTTQEAIAVIFAYRQGLKDVTLLRQELGLGNQRRIDQ